ncbi:MAG: endopeptidase La [Rickettsiales bacterium]|jgi:ATP-dependent Lon protease|nr:endopeptidase La [Rickettsiales bacterium]
MRYPILSLNGIVIQPGLSLPIFVERPAHAQALFEIQNKTVILAAIKKNHGDVHPYGTLARVANVIQSADGAVQVNIQTLAPIRITDVRTEANGELSGEAAETFPQETTITPRAESLKERAVDMIRMLSRSRKMNYENIRAVISSHSWPLFIDAAVSALGLGIETAQKMIIAKTFEDKLEILVARLSEEIQLMDLDNTIKSRVSSQMTKAHREAYLTEKMRAIQKELGDDEASDANTLKQKIQNAKLPKEVNDKAMSELKKLRNLPPMSSESSVIKNWLDEVIALPWNTEASSEIDLDAAQKIMDEDHDGLEKIKERVIEHLAVIKQTKKSGGAILCFVGPPGVGKTSLGKSIARAMGREYARISLGGVSDESHFRGHRKTYIGSQPGRIIDTLKRVKVKNPVIVLDEIDKMGRDYRGDPEAALLEILDPEQNKTFRDHYLECEFDLSNVMFIATANSRDLSRPLLDRMEIINLSGYVEDEKIRIAQNHLIKNAAEKIGMNPANITISDDTIRHIIRFYTQEAGVRELQRLIETILRKSLRNSKNDFSVAQVGEWLGVQKYDFGRTDKEDAVGIINGLSWSEVGGDILQLEAVQMPGKGNVIITGQLGEVMKESAQIAKSCAQTLASEFGIGEDAFKKTDIHIHALSGAVPKDGPSAGLALCSVIMSALSGVAIRRDIAVTGEISLHGRAMPIGGLREKLLGARRGGVRIVMIPEENRKDLADIPEYIYEGMELKFVNNIRDVIDIALTTRPLPVAPAVRIVGKEYVSAN